MFIVPCAPISRATIPTGLSWIHQPKLDGWRAQAHVTAREVQLYTRGGHDIAARVPSLVLELRALPPGTVVDAELVLHRPDGSIAFYDMPRALRPGHDHGLVLWAFDVLVAAGDDIRHLALETRQDALGEALAGAGDRIRKVETFADGEALLRACEARGHEGVVSKKRGSRYVSGPWRAWTKVKTRCWLEANRERWRAFERAG